MNTVTDARTARSATTSEGSTGALWFLDNLARVRLDGAGVEGGIDAVEITARKGDMPPLHVHEREDEFFIVLEGEISLHLPGTSRTLTSGEAAHAPRGVPHTYRVESAAARWLAISNPSGFAAFVTAVADPAGAEELPPAGRPADMELLGSAAAAAGIEILGPPGTRP